MSRKNRQVNKAPLWRFLFVVYCAAMLWLLFGRSQSWVSGAPYQQLLAGNINLTPLLTIRNYYSVVMQGASNPYFIHCVINLLGNVLLFIPAGWLLPKVFPFQRNFFRFFVTCTGLIFLVETVQLFTLLGSFDIDDLILNLTGMIIGFMVYHICVAGKRQA